MLHMLLEWSTSSHTTASVNAYAYLYIMCIVSLFMDADENLGLGGGVKGEHRTRPPGSGCLMVRNGCVHIAACDVLDARMRRDALARTSLMNHQIFASTPAGRSGPARNRRPASSCVSPPMSQVHACISRTNNRHILIIIGIRCWCC